MRSRKGHNIRELVEPNARYLEGLTGDADLDLDTDLEIDRSNDTL